MKLIIDIPEEVYTTLKNIDWTCVPFDAMAAYEFAIAEGTPIKDDATNEKVIETLFPDADVCPQKGTPITTMTVGGVLMAKFDSYWMEDKYKKEE